MDWCDEVIHEPDRDKRFELVTVDCYNEYEEAVALAIYVTDCMRYPFQAVLAMDADDPHAERFEIIGATEGRREGDVRFQVRRGGKTGTIAATDIALVDPDPINQMVLEDYLSWLGR